MKSRGFPWFAMLARSGNRSSNGPRERGVSDARRVAGKRRNGALLWRKQDGCRRKCVTYQHVSIFAPVCRQFPREKARIRRRDNSFAGSSMYFSTGEAKGPHAYRVCANGSYAPRGRVYGPGSGAPQPRGPMATNIPVNCTAASPFCSMTADNCSRALPLREKSRRNAANASAAGAWHTARNSPVTALS
jgi:hypothetical protein